jgi:hypothetical protein
MGSLDCNEYENLRRRDFREYSLGHRIVYETPIKLLTGKKRTIIEAGFGIGWGLDKMVEADIIADYVGCEPNADSFKYVNGRHGGKPNIKLNHEPFKRGFGFAQHVFCIEVIEHVPMEKHAEFIRALRESGQTLWFSTPCKSKVPSEGVRTTEEWTKLLKQNGYSDVTVHKEQWTHLCVAQ